MESVSSAAAGVEAVGADLEKALCKFRYIDDHASRVLDDCIESVIRLREELSSVPDDFNLTENQLMIVNETLKRCKETVQRLAGDHRDIHASVSRVGKSIDRHFVADYVAVAPRAAQFGTESNRKLTDRAIVQHLYRQGLDSAAEMLAEEANITDEVSQGEPFAALQRIATALSQGDAAPALAWVHQHADDLASSPLPFALHRLRFLQMAREAGAVAAVLYARQHFPQYAARHERDLQRAMCALAWCVNNAGEARVPEAYSALLDIDSLAIAASDLFIKEACSLLRLAALSPLAAAALAGCRVLPALLDIRTKITHPHVTAAWAAKDELPLEVDLGEEDGCHHSVFACPILRQQASEANPPMRLLCGHVISRDALGKLTQGSKLKCPYCPTEQSPAEARLIYFS